MNEQGMVRISLTTMGGVLLAVCGCRKVSNNAGPDTVVEELNRIRPMAVREGFEDRIEKVLSMWTNGVTDSPPYLLYGILSESREIVLCLYDENVDIVGLGVQEQYVGTDGENSVLVEEYPVFLHRPASGSCDYRRLPLHVRDAGQRKDVALWDRYAAGVGIDAGRTRYIEYYRETLPPIWVSIPDPNTIDVRLYLYDRAGNKSKVLRPIGGRSLPPVPAQAPGHTGALRRRGEK